MGDRAQVELKPERWAEDLRPLLARVASGARAARWLEGVIGAIERGDVALFVARAPSLLVVRQPSRGAAPDASPSPGAPLALLVTAFKRFPIPAVHVLAMAAVPRSGFKWGAAGVAQIAELGRRAGAEELEAEALTEAHRRRLARIGFRQRSSLMVLPCA